MKIKTTQQLLDYTSTKEQLEEPILYFCHTLINLKAIGQNKYLSSDALQKTFGNRYSEIIVNLMNDNIIDRFWNYQDDFRSYYTYKLLVDTSEIIETEIFDNKLLKRIKRIKTAQWNKLKYFEQQIYKNIGMLELPVNTPITNHYIKKSKNTGRLFHTITSMKKIYRCDLKHPSGDQLVEIDAKNAQLIMLAQICDCDESFNNDVYNGTIYTVLADHLGINIACDKTRGKFKQKLFSNILFTENRVIIRNSKIGKAIEAIYPIMFNFLTEQINLDVKKATELQRAEVNLFIDNIAKDIVNNNIWVVTIHDAFIICKSDIDKVTKIINDNSFATLGKLIPTSINEICPTPLFNNTAYSRIDKIAVNESWNKNNPSIAFLSCTNSKGVGQNKNELKSDETKDRIRQAIIDLNNEGIKITVRKIKEISGVAKASVEKHYKSILSDYSNNNNKVEQDTIQTEKALEIASNEATEVSNDEIEYTPEELASINEYLEKMNAKYDKKAEPIEEPINNEEDELDETDIRPGERYGDYLTRMELLKCNNK